MSARDAMPWARVGSGKRSPRSRFGGQAAEAAGADIIVAQGAEAGGHRASFTAATAEQQLVGLFALIPAIVDSVSVPVIAAGGIADGRGVAAVLMLGASAVQLGTGFLRTPEARIHPAWADAIGRAAPEDTVVSRVFSGRAGRSLVSDYVKHAMAQDAPDPAPYPIQRALTAPMRKEALEHGDVHRMQAWAGQSARLSRAMPADRLIRKLWKEALTLLRDSHPDSFRPSTAWLAGWVARRSPRRNWDTH